MLNKFHTSSTIYHLHCSIHIIHPRSLLSPKNRQFPAPISKMHCIRRAALRAAWSSTATATAAPRQLASRALQMGRLDAKPAILLPLSRSFSRSAAFAQEDANTTVDPSATESEATSEVKATPPTEESGIFVANMSYDVTEEHLREAFSKYGEIQHIKVVKNPEGLSKGFGFVEFASPEEAKQAAAEANDSYWHGRQIRVDVKNPNPNKRKTYKPQSRSQNGSADGPTTSLFVGNIPYETTDAQLNEIFRGLENVVDVRVAVDRNTGWPRGFAHADFLDVESAQKGLEKLSGVQLSGRSLRIDFARIRSPRGPAGNKRGDRSENVSESNQES
ncbi:RNA-binding domain-containing protein [Poronia punctata]|nr:RNA-binding domain-containing protein [Poronia punctata]